MTMTRDKVAFYAFAHSISLLRCRASSIYPTRNVDADRSFSAVGLPLGEWNRYQRSTHHVSRLEIPLWAFGMHIVTVGAVLRHDFIGIGCLEDARPALGGTPVQGRSGFMRSFASPVRSTLTLRALFY